MNLDAAIIPSYYSRLVMAKNQGHFKIAEALLELITSSEIEDSETPEGHKALEKIAQAKGHAQAISAGNENEKVPPEGEASDWEAYVVENPPYTRKLALALADYFKLASRLNQAYEMYMSAVELDDDGSASEAQALAMNQAENGTMANEFGKKCEANGNFVSASDWFSKAKAAGCTEAADSMARMQAFHGVSRYYTPWLKIATATGRKELAEAIQKMVSADPKLAGTKLEPIAIAESAVPPCYEELDFWEAELDDYVKFSKGENTEVGSAIAAVGKLLERAKIYNIALRWYKKAVTFNAPGANQDAHRMLPLKSKSAPMREAEYIYDEASPIPAMWKLR